MSETETFLKERVATTKAQIVALEEAQLALASGAIQSYTLNTGQTQQTVTKASIGVIQNQIERLLNRLSVLDARLNGNGVLRAVPGW